MSDNLEKSIKAVYGRWRKSRKPDAGEHPDEETLACFMEGRLSDEESCRIKEHVLVCDRCAEAVMAQAQTAVEGEDLPPALIEKIKNLPVFKNKGCFMEIVLKVKEQALEVINSSGDVLVGQELIPASVLRSRRKNEFGNEVTVFKDFDNIRVEVRIEKQDKESFKAAVAVRNKQTQKAARDVRITIIKDGVELESYLAHTGSVTFEHIRFGAYLVEVSAFEQKLASIMLDIKN